MLALLRYFVNVLAGFSSAGARGHGRRDCEILSLACHGEILTAQDPGAPMLPKGRAFEDIPDNPAATLPSWLSEEDIHDCAAKYELNGFTGALSQYRNLDRNWELTAPWTVAKVEVPSMLIVGSLDLVYNMVGMKEYMNGGFKEDALLLENLIVMDDVGHFINQEKA